MAHSNATPLYAAENATNWTGPATTPLTATDARALVTDMVDWLIATGWDITPDPTVAVTNGGTASALIDAPMVASGAIVGTVPASITFGADALVTRPWVVAHEVAHLVRPDESLGVRDSHGPVFASIYLTLVREFYGDDNADALAASLAEYGLSPVN